MLAGTGHCLAVGMMGRGPLVGEMRRGKVWIVEECPVGL